MNNSTGKLKIFKIWHHIRYILNLRHCSFISKISICVFFFIIIINVSDSILDIWNRVIITFFMSLACHSHVCQLWVSFKWLICLFIMAHIFLLLCVPGNLWLDTRHRRYYLVVFWMYFYKYSWPLLRGAVKLLRNGLILFCILLLEFVRWERSRAQTRPNYSPFLRQEPLCTLYSAPILRFSSLAHGNRHCSPWVWAGPHYL